MHFSWPEMVQYALGLALEAGVWLLAIRRKLYRRLRLFTIYLAAVFLCDVFRWLPILLWGLRSKEYLWTYWSTQALLVVLRGAVVFEIAWYVLRHYPGVWRLCRAVLALVGFGLAATALIAAGEKGTYVLRVIVEADRGLELAIVGVLLFALAFCRYYRIRIDRPCALISLGLGFYCAVQVINNTIASQWLAPYFPEWNRVWQYSFAVALAIWIIALWRPLPEAASSPDLLEPEVYQILAPVLSNRLRDLNSRLEGLLK